MKYCVTSLLLVGLCIIMLPANAETGMADLDDPLFGDFPIVISATKSKQSLRDAPATVTRITAEDIAKRDPQNIAELLRMVPGFVVYSHDADDMVVSYHGANGAKSKRIGILINGFPIVVDDWSKISWNLLPVSLENIERIEVVQGASASSYGNDAFQAAINIITKDPSSTPQDYLHVYTSSYGGKNALYRHSAKVADTFFNVTAESINLDGMNKESAPRDDLTQKRITFDSTTELKHGALEARVTLLDSEEEEFNSSISGFSFLKQTTPPTVETDYLFETMRYSFVWGRHETVISQQYSQLDTGKEVGLAGPTWLVSPQAREYALSHRDLVVGLLQMNPEKDDPMLILGPIMQSQGGGDFLALIQSTENDIFDATHEARLEEERFSLELLDNFSVNEQLNLVSSLGYVSNRVTSKTFFDGTATQNKHYVSTNAQYKPNTFLTFNLGGFVSHQDNSDDLATSYRSAINFHLSDAYTLRFGYAEAEWMPGLMETDRDWNIYVDFDQPIGGETSGVGFWNSKAEGELDNERSVSKEIALLGHHAASGINWDIRVFDEKYTDLLSTPSTFLDFTLANDDSFEMTGADFQVLYPLSERMEARLSLYYVDLEATNPIDKAFYSRYGGSGFVGYGFDNGYKVGFSYYGNHAVKNASMDRFDINLHKRFIFADQSSLTPKLTVIYRGGDLKSGNDYKEFYNTIHSEAEVLLSVEYSH